MRQSGVYRISLGGIWFYIGSTKNFTQRRRQHLADLRGGTKHWNQIMQQCWNKYGVFEFEVLEYCHESERVAKEQALLDIYFGTAGCANLCPVAENVAGRKHTQATKDKISASHKVSAASIANIKKLAVTPLSPETLKRKSDAQKKSPAAIEARRILHETPWTDERRQKRSKSWHDSPSSVAHLDQLNNSPENIAHLRALAEKQRGEHRSPLSLAHSQAISDGLLAYHANKQIAV